MSDPTYPDYLSLRRGPTAPPPDPHEEGVRVYADEDGALHSLQSDGTDAPIGGGGSLPSGWTTNAGATEITAPDADTVPLAFKPLTGATDDQTDQIEIYDDTDTLIGYWDAAGNLSVNGTLHVKLLGGGALQIKDHLNRALIQVFEDGGAFVHSLPDGGTAHEFYDSLGNLIFKVDANGDLHGKTGKALTFDL